MDQFLTFCRVLCRVLKSFPAITENRKGLNSGRRKGELPLIMTGGGGGLFAGV